MSERLERVPLLGSEDDISHRSPRVKWLACAGIFLVGSLALITAIGVSYNMSLDIHNVTTIRPGTGTWGETPGLLLYLEARLELSHLDFVLLIISFCNNGNGISLLDQFQKCIISENKHLISFKTK